ncbi:MAG: prepilin-type N-terminal cleavage/methylation domain-containing protein [Candidatus Kerfeldbacteria bacterium]
MRRIKRKRHPSPRQCGFTLLEALLSLAVVLLLSVLMVSMASVRGVNRSTAFRSQAAVLADEEINALRRAGFENLPTQTSCTPVTNCPLRNVLYNAGSWSVVVDNNDSSSHTVPNVLMLAKSTGFSGTPSGLLKFPEETYGNVALIAKWKVVSDSVSSNDPNIGWSIGYVARASYAGTLYRLRIGEYTIGGIQTDYDTVPTAPGKENVYLEKLVNGVSSRLASANATIAKNEWYTLELVVSDTPTPVTITVKINSNTVATATDASSPLTSGAAALVGWNGVHAEVDDIQTVTTETKTWNFDTPVTPTMPAAWIRLGLNDLPDSTPTVFNDNGYVVIEPYPDAGSTTMKQATVTITWQQSNGATKTYSASSLIGQSGLGL